VKEAPQEACAMRRGPGRAVGLEDGVSANPTLRAAQKQKSR